MKRQSLLNLSNVNWEDHTGRYPILYNCNIYFGCEHNCRYCYARKIYYWKKDWANAEPVENAVELVRKEVNKLEPGRIMFSSMMDPYQPIEEKTGLTRQLLRVLLESKHLVLVMMKSDMVLRDLDILRGHDNVEVGFTVTFLEDQPKWEPGARGNTARIEALIKLHNAGVKTYISMEPWIPSVTKPIEVMEKLGPWVDRWIVGTLNYSGADYSFYEKEMPELLKYVHERGLNVMWKKELRQYLI